MPFLICLALANYAFAYPNMKTQNNKRSQNNVSKIVESQTWTMGLNWFFFHLAYNKFRLTLIMYTATLLWLRWWWWLLLLFLWLLSNSTAIIIVAICVVIVYGTFRCIDKVPFQFIFTGACFTDCQRFNSSEIFTNAMLIVHFHSPWYKFVFVVFISCFMSSICFVIVLFSSIVSFCWQKLI